MKTSKKIGGTPSAKSRKSQNLGDRDLKIFKARGFFQKFVVKDNVIK